MSLLDDAKIMLEIMSTDFDPILELIIDGIKVDADECMQLKISAVEDYTEYLNGGRRTLYLQYANISNLTLTEDETELDEGNDYDYILYSERGIVKKTSGTFTSGMKIITANYDGGYDEDDIPKSIRTELLRQTCYEFRRRKDQGLSAVTYPDGTINKFSVTEWLPKTEQILLRQKRYFI